MFLDKLFQAVSALLWSLKFAWGKMEIHLSIDCLCPEESIAYPSPSLTRESLFPASATDMGT